MNQSSRAATENFVFLRAANNGSLKTNCCFESRARYNALAKIWPASRQENGFFKVWPVGVIALFTDNILHLHYNDIEHECEAISGKNDKIARNCLVSTLNCIVMQMSKVFCEKGYSFDFHE